MSLWGRLLGSKRSDSFAEGVALFDDGRFAEAADRLRSAALGRSNSPSGSLASSYFRKALLAEGRRLMRQDKAKDALQYLEEAVRLWDLYPDLHCLHGAALADAGRLDEALQEARFALRLNPDYVEARLLHATVLVQMDRPLEAADQLNAMLESGRRGDHWLLQEYARDKSYTAETLPNNLMEKLVASLSGKSEKEELSAAVSLCREGQWAEGKAVFAALVRRRPRYPDYRTRLAAAHFQLGELESALEQVDAALALNESYRTAVDLKGLILADSGRLNEARSWLNDARRQPASPSRSGAHEELFGAYLRSVLALLAGDLEEVRRRLSPWPDLVRNFARAELLLAAAEDLRGQQATCERRLADLADEWPGEEIYFFVLACHHLENGRFREADGILRRWPKEHRGSEQHRFLEEFLRVSEGRGHDKPQRLAESTESDLGPEAWTFLEARAAYQEGRDEEAWRLCLRLCDQGLATEKLLRLQTAAMAGVPPEVLGEARQWQPTGVLPDSCLTPLFHLDVRRGHCAEAREMAVHHLRLHPENLKARWLLVEFWLSPVRGWLA